MTDDAFMTVDRFDVSSQRFSRGPWPSQMGYVVTFEITTDETVKEFKKRIKDYDQSGPLALKEPSGRRVTIESFFVNAVKGAVVEQKTEEGSSSKIIGELWGKEVDVREPLGSSGLGMW